MKKINPDDFRVRPGKKVDLDKWPTKVKPAYNSKEEYETILREHAEKLSDQQSLLYATNHYAMLLIFQAMDAAGKDSAIKYVMSGINLQGTATRRTVSQVPLDVWTSLPTTKSLGLALAGSSLEAFPLPIL